MLSKIRQYYMQSKNVIYRYSSLIVPISLIIVITPIIAAIVIGITNIFSPLLTNESILPSIILGIITSLIASLIYSLTIKVKLNNVHKSCIDLYGEELVNQYLSDLEDYNGQLIYDQNYKFVINKLPHTDKYLMLNCEVDYKKRLSHPLLKFKFLRKTCETDFENEIEYLTKQYKSSNFEYLYINDECDFNLQDECVKNYRSNFNYKEFIEHFSVKNSLDMSAINHDNIRYISTTYENIEFDINIIGRMYKPKEKYRFSYSYSFLIEADSYIYIPLEVPTFNFSFSFDYSSISESHDVSGKTLIDSESGFEPNLRGDSRHIISDNCNKYIFPKGGIVINWWIKDRN